MNKPAKRRRKPTNLTLSTPIKKGGRALAESRGVTLSALVEQALRVELIEAGKLPSGSAM